MRVTVVIPWLAGCEHRERALDWVQARYAERHPDWQVVVSPGGTPWCKARAVWPAIQEADGVVVVADADVFCEGLELAVCAVEQGWPWAIPHGNVYRLSPATTDALVNGLDLTEACRGELAERSYPGMQGGGYVVARKQTITRVPMDPRFVGWGQEDISWAIALHHLLGPAWRGSAPLAHLWHPPQERTTRKRGSRDNELLRRRYVRVRRDKRGMRELIEEARRALDSPEQDRHARAA